MAVTMGCFHTANDGKSEDCRKRSACANITQKTQVVLDQCCKNCKSNRRLLYFQAIMNIMFLVAIIILFIMLNNFAKKIESAMQRTSESQKPERGFTKNLFNNSDVDSQLINNSAPLKMNKTVENSSNIYRLKNLEGNFSAIYNYSSKRTNLLPTPETKSKQPLKLKSLEVLHNDTGRPPLPPEVLEVRISALL